MSGPRLRFAPSPTGRLHLGSALTAVANAAAARAGGTLILRIDDTDEKRNDAASEESIFAGLRWLNIDWQDGPYHQRGRHAVYERHLQELREAGHAYPCFCSPQRLDELAAAQRAAGEPPRYDRRCRDLSSDVVDQRIAAGEAHSIRLFVGDSDRSFTDAVYGDIAVPAGSFGDFVIRRSDGGYAYQFASVVDDLDLDISLVVRGSDHLANTGRQLAVFEALGATSPPLFAHLPLLASSDGRKLSKRDPLGTLDELIDAGYPPEAVRAYLWELLGQGDEDPLADATGQIDWSRVPHSTPTVSVERLASLARSAMGARSEAALLADIGCEGEPRLGPLVRALAAESPTTSSLREQVLMHATPSSVAPAIDVSADARDLLHTTFSSCAFEHADDAAALIAELRAKARERGVPMGAVLKPLRMILTGQDHGPPLDTVLWALGASTVRDRLAEVLGSAGADARGAEGT